MKKILSTTLALIILASSSVLAVTSYAVSPTNQLSQSYGNTQYSSFIVPADTIPASAGYQQVEYITCNDSSSVLSKVLSDSGMSTSITFNGFGTSEFLYLDRYVQTNGVSDVQSYRLFCTLTDSGLSTQQRTNSSVYPVYTIPYSSGLVPESFVVSLVVNQIYFPSLWSKALYTISLNDTTSPELTRFLDRSSSPYNNSGRTGNSMFNLFGNYVCFNLAYDVYKFIPCYRTSDGAVGLYYTKDGSFITTSGLSCGPSVMGVTAPVISEVSTNQSMYLTGASPELHVLATTELGTLSYQWQRADPTPLGYTEFSNISGATNYYYTPSTFDDLGDYKFRCVVTSTLGSSSLSTTSSEITVSVVEADPDIPIITTQPQSAQYYDNDSNLTALSCQAELDDSSEGTLSYQWQYKDQYSVWRDISGATSSSYNISSIAGEIGTYEYRCVVSNTLASVVASATSSTAVIQIVDYNPFEDFWTSFFGSSGSGLTAVTNATQTIKTFNFNNLPTFSNVSGLVGLLFGIIPAWIWALFTAQIFFGLILMIYRRAGK